MQMLGRSYQGRGAFAQSDALFIEAFETSRRTWGPEDFSTVRLLADAAVAYQRQGKYDLAEACASRVLATRRRDLGSEHPDTAAVMAELALDYVSLGKFAEGERLAREAMETYRRKLPDGWEAFRAESLLGASLAGQERYTEAEPLLLAGYQGMLVRRQRMTAGVMYYLDHARDSIVHLYQAWGKPDKVTEWKKRTD